MSPAPPSRRRVALFIALVFAGAAAVLGWVTAAQLSSPLPSNPATMGLLAAMLVVGELVPISIERQGEREAINLSGAFACALLLRWGPAPAVAAQAVAALLYGAIHRIAWWKRLFNIAQYTLSLGLASLAFRPFGTLAPGHPLAALAVGGALLATCTFFVTNHTLMGIVLALIEGAPVVRFLVADAAFQASINGVATALAPLVLVAVDSSPWLLALLLLPAVVLYQWGRMALEQEHRSRHDLLTDLPNRLAFGEAVAAAIRQAGLSGTAVGVVMMDIDAFRELNDTLGHSAGDALLRQVGDRLAPELGRGEVLARLGGDEFGILLPALADHDQVVAAARRLVAHLDGPFEVDGVALDVRASVGIAVFPEHGHAVDELIQHADVAMYLSKARRSGCEVYTPERNEHSRRRLTLLNELRPAIASSTLVLHYQPKADMRTGRLCGLEALLRWPHPQLGMVPPAEFIGLAEYTGLMRPLTEYVLDQACDQLAGWERAGLAVPTAVNISARVLHDESFPERVGRRLAQYGLRPDLLVLELTESAIMAEPENSLRVMQELADMGIRLSIDDFGTGYSSLAYLSKVPAGEVKIDRSFVTRLDTHPQNSVIVGSTIELARNLGMDVAAEGVETIPVWQALARMGCTTAQGYLIARPEPADVVTALLREGKQVPMVEEFAVSFGVNRSVAV